MRALDAPPRDGLPVKGTMPVDELLAFADTLESNAAGMHKPAASADTMSVGDDELGPRAAGQEPIATHGAAPLLGLSPAL